MCAPNVSSLLLIRNLDSVDIWAVRVISAYRLWRHTEDSAHVIDKWRLHVWEHVLQVMVEPAAAQQDY